MVMDANPEDDTPFVPPTEPTTKDYLSDMLDLMRANQETLEGISDVLYRLADHLGAG